MEPTDEDLYSRIKRGDQRAMEQLYERREPALYRYALHASGDRTIAEEATHEAFLALIQPGSRFDPSRGSLEAYMYGTVRNLIRSLRRTQSVGVEVDRSTQHDILGALIGDQQATALHGALQDLPTAYRDAVILCDLEERSYEDAAKLMECPVGTIRSRLHRARQMLAAKLKSLRTSSRLVAR